jgi:hypothetical protein
MADRNKYHGIAVSFGVASQIGSVVGVFQTRDHGLESDNEIIRNGTGDEVEKTFYGTGRETCTFEYVASQTGGPAGNATVTYPTIGDAFTVTDTNYPAIAGTSWLCDGVDIKGSNTTAVRVTVKATRYALISS